MGAGESYLSALGYDAAEHVVLAVVRCFLEGFCNPKGQCWINAFTIADDRFGSPMGPAIAFDTLEVLRTLRTARRSVFMFSRSSCPTCAEVVTEHERRLMSALHALRRGAHGQAGIELMMLCEGNDTGPMLSKLSTLTETLARPSAPAKGEPNVAHIH